MNLSIYIFGRFDSEFTQYPDDYTREFFENFESKIKSDAQLLIHRRGDVIYYAYIRRLSGAAKYIGLCFVFNGVMLSNVSQLCVDCEARITELVVRGEILYFAKNGDIVPRSTKLYKVASEFTLLTQALKTSLESQAYFYDVLPSVNFSVAVSDTKSIAVDHIPAKDDSAKGMNDKISKALQQYSNVEVYLGDTPPALFSYSATLRTLNEENVGLRVENAAVMRQKKRTKIVAVLAITIAIGLVSLVRLLGQNNMQQQQIDGLNSDVNDLQANLSQSDRRVIALNDSLTLAYARLSLVYQKLKNLRTDSVNLTTRVMDLRNSLDDKMQEIASLNMTVANKNESIDLLRSENAKLKKQVEQLQSSSKNANLSVTGIQLSPSTSNSFGKTLRASGMTSLKVKINYVDNSVYMRKISVVLYGPGANGLIEYSRFTEDCKLQSSGSYVFTALLRYGLSMSRFKRGTYKIDILENGTMLKHYSFQMM